MMQSPTKRWHRRIRGGRWDNPPSLVEVSLARAVPAVVCGCAEKIRPIDEMF
jgi:hypothetical protein